MNRLAIPNIKIEIVFPYIAYSVWLFFTILYQSFYAQYIVGVTYYGIRLFCIGILLISEIVSHQQSDKSVFAYAILIAISIISIVADAKAFIEVALLIMCLRRCDFRLLIKISLTVTVVASVFIVISALMGLIQNYVSTYPRTRVYLGFRYVLYPAQIAFMITCMVVFLRGSRFGISDGLLCLCLNYVVFCITDARLSFFLSIVLIFLAFFLKYENQNKGIRAILNRCLKPLLVWSYVIAAVISIGITISYNPSIEWMASLNDWLGQRLSLGYSGLIDFGIPLFGQDIELVGNGLDIDGERNTSLPYNYIDSLYVYVLVKLGLIFFVIYIMLSVLACRKAEKTRDYPLLIVLGIIAAHGIIDNLTLFLQYNPFLIYYGFLINSSEFNREINRFRIFGRGRI